MARFHLTTKTDLDGEDDSHDAAPAPAWATHDPPRPVRATLAPHGGGADLFQLHGPKRSASHKQTATRGTRKDADKDRDVAVAVERAAGARVVYQVVIDKVGHGVAPDQPVLVPEPAPAEVSTAALSFAAVESAGGSGGMKGMDMQAVAQRAWQWKHRDSIELGLVGAAVVLVAAVVMAIARRQQRAYDRQQQQQQRTEGQAGQDAEAPRGAVDLENGALRLATSDIRVTRDDDEIGTPASEDEGVV